MVSYTTWLIGAAVGSFALIQFAPQYSVSNSVVWTAVSIFILESLAYELYDVIIYPKFLSPLRHLPQPGGASFILGHFGKIRRDPAGTPQREWVHTIPNNGLIRYLMLFNKERLLITSPKLLGEVLTTNSYTFIKPQQLRGGLGRLLGIGVLLAEGDEHKQQRRSLMPAFAFRHIKDLYPVFWSKSIELVNALQDHVTSQPADSAIEMGDWASRATLDIIGVAGMGQDFNALKDPNSELTQTYQKIFKPTRAQQIFGLLGLFISPKVLALIPVKRNDDLNAACQVARDTCRRVVEQKKIRLANKEPMDPDIISVALESGGFSDENLVDQMMTFLAAGSETTASAMQWAIYALSQNLGIQKRLREEISKSISLDDEIDAAKIDGISYLHAVCNEVLRVHPPVPLTLRITGHNTFIGQEAVPKGTTIILSPAAINASSELWGPDAGEFNPDRWMGLGKANTGGATSNYAFMTFLHGPRSCIGQKFSQAEFACLLAAFVAKFEFVMKDPNEKVEIKGSITARPANGMNVILTPVEDA
ncbi:MAG: hypothetical protein Q9160_003752 [Pyrenula sp. 1 TL-2023]